MINKKIIFVGLVISCQANFVSAEIFKWVDDKGITHYSENVPVNKAFSNVKIQDPPSDKIIKKAQEKSRRLIEKQREEERVRRISQTKTEEKCNLIRSQLTQLSLPGPFSFPVKDGGVIVVVGQGKLEFVDILKKDLKKNRCKDFN